MLSASQPSGNTQRLCAGIEEAAQVLFVVFLYAMWHLVSGRVLITCGVVRDDATSRDAA